jgi:hypothetical protein
MSDNSFNFYPRLDGLNNIDADNISTSALTTSTLTATSFKTNLVQSINDTNNLTLEALTTGQVIIRSNGVNIAIFDSANNLITFNSKVSQVLGDFFISNCVFGYLAGSLLPSSGSLMYGNSCFGQEAGRNISGTGSQGSYNTCVGYRAGRNITTGQQNTILGSECQNFSTGSGVVAIGHRSGFNLSSGSNNMFLGTGSSYGTTTGGDNVSCGYYAGVFQSSQGSFSRNISFGREANQAVNGSDNIAIGYRANFLTFPSLLSAFTNSIVIGNSNNNTLSNQILIGSGSQWLTTPRISIGKLTSPLTLLDVEGASDFNGNVTIRNNNNLQIFNNGNTQQTNAFMLNNDYFVNNSSSSGSIQLRINGNTRFNLTDTNIFLGTSNVTSGQYNVCLGFQSCQALTSGIDNIALGLFSGVQNNTASQGALQRNISIGREAGNALNGNENITLGWRSNYLVSGLLSAFTNSVCIGNNNNNTLSNQILVGSGSQWLTTPKLSVNKLTSPVQTVDIVGTLDVTSVITTPTRPNGTNDNSVATTAFVQNAVSSVATQTPTTSKYLFDECWDGAYNQCPIGGYNWTWQGTGGNSFVYGDANHPGQYGMSANKAIMSSLFYHYPVQEITFIAKTENTTNTGDIFMGLCIAYGNYARSAMIRKTTATNTFSAVTNNVNKGNFTTVSWTTNVWYEFKITFSNPNISYKITNLTSNVTETITDNTAVFDFSNQTMLFFQIGSGGGTNSAHLDFVSVTYQVPTRA